MCAKAIGFIFSIYPFLSLGVFCVVATPSLRGVLFPCSSFLLCPGGVARRPRPVLPLSLSSPDSQPPCDVAVLQSWPCRIRQIPILCVVMRVADPFFVLSYWKTVICKVVWDCRGKKPLFFMDFFLCLRKERQVRFVCFIFFLSR